MTSLIWFACAHAPELTLIMWLLILAPTLLGVMCLVAERHGGR